MNPEPYLVLGTYLEIYYGKFLGQSITTSQDLVKEDDWVKLMGGLFMKVIELQINWYQMRQSCDY